MHSDATRLGVLTVVFVLRVSRTQGGTFRLSIYFGPVYNIWLSCLDTKMYLGATSRIMTCNERNPCVDSLEQRFHFCLFVYKASQSITYYYCLSGPDRHVNTAKVGFQPCHPTILQYDTKLISTPTMTRFQGGARRTISNDDTTFA